MSSTSQTLDEFIAERLTATIAAAHPGATTTIAPAATWTLCGSLAERGLAVSDSSGVAAKQIGPFRLALKGDGPDTVNAMIETVIPIAVSYAAADGSSSAAYYVAALSFAFHVLSATCASGCLIKSPDEWEVLLFIKSQNQRKPSSYPNVDDIKRHFSGTSGRSLPSAAVDASIDALKAKKPIWGAKEVDLIKEDQAGGYIALA